jgi:hypothetical protein
MRRVAALALSLLVTLTGAQSQLKIAVLEGDRAVNDIRKRTAREPVVEVRDAADRPVTGASVTFLLPDSGPSGVFPNGSRLVSTTTDENGQAAAIGLRPNTVAGEFQIRVTASYQGQTASATLTQTNVGTPPSRIPGKLIALLALGGGAATGVLIATGGGAPSRGDGQPARPVITPGTPEVGRPR